MSQSQKFFDEDKRAEAFADKVLANMCSPQIDSAFGEDVWEEIMRIVSIPTVRERMDALEDMTILDVMKRAVERRVKAMIERGDFQ